MSDNIYAARKDKGRCVVFDFDCTLTYTHYFYFLNMFQQYASSRNPWYVDITKNKNLITMDELDKLALDIEENGNDSKGKYLVEKIDKNTLINIFFGGETRFQRLVKMFDTLYNELEYDIYISSRGQCENILSLIHAVGIAKYIVEIDANAETDDIKCKYNGGKTEYILGVLSQKYYNIMYIDDDNTEYLEINYDIRSGKSNIKYYGFDEINLKKNNFGLDLHMMEYIESDARDRKETITEPQVSELTNPIEISNPNYSNESWRMSPDYSVFDSGRMSPDYSMFKTNNVTSLPQTQNTQYINMNDYFNNRFNISKNLTRGMDMSTDMGTDMGTDMDLSQSMVIRNPNYNSGDELNNSNEIDLNGNMVINNQRYRQIQGGSLGSNNAKNTEEYYKHKYLKYKQKYLAEKAKYLSKHK